MKRLTSLLLAIIISGGMIISCAAGANGPTETNSDTTAPTVTGAPEATAAPETEPETIPETTAAPETEPPTPEEIMERELASFNYIIGTQAFSPGYTFTDEDPLIEIAGRIQAMGSNAIKFYATDDDMIDELLERYPDFSHILMWYISNQHFKDGYSKAEADADYDAVYNYTRKLLKEYNGSGKNFYLGHWEGDWYYIDNYNGAQEDVDDTVTYGMIDWINNRQKAVDDAKRDTPHENVYVWNYIELNRPTDAYYNGFDRVVNMVLPETKVDYVSYSAYDSMNSSAKDIANIIDYIYENLPDKEGVPGPRVFIGEVGQPAANLGFNPKSHNRSNLNIISKYLKCDVKFVLYWQMYCNEKLEDGSPRGFWLVNDKNEEQPLYTSLQSVLTKAKEYVRNYYIENGHVPSHEEYKSFLLEQKEF